MWRSFLTEFFENIQKWRFCKCRSVHIRQTSHIKVTNVCKYIFATYGQFVLVFVLIYAWTDYCELVLIRRYHVLLGWPSRGILYILILYCSSVCLDPFYIVAILFEHTVDIKTYVEQIVTGRVWMNRLLIQQ